MRARIPDIARLILCSFPLSALAHHPGEELDEVMAAQEPFFQAIDQAAPEFDLAAPDGTVLSLPDLADQIVVLDYLPAECGNLCSERSERLAEVQEKVNASAMRDMVQFLTVAEDFAASTPEATEAFAEAHGLDPVNWMLLVSQPGDPADAVRELAEAYARLLPPTPDNEPAEGAAFFVIDRGGRLAGGFHGLDFEPLNMVLYINGLTNAPRQEGDGD